MHPGKAVAPVFATLLLALTAAPSQAQSDAASHASRASLAALSEVPSAALELLAAGGNFSVIALRPLGHSVEVVLHSTVEGVQFSVHVAAATVETLALATGSVIRVSAVSAGYLLQAGGEVIAFVPSALASGMIHQRELQR